MITNELRIGNKVLYRGNIITVEGIQPTYVWTDYQTGNIHALHLSRIILNEDWLLRFGFEKKSDRFYRNENMSIHPLAGHKYYRFRTARKMTKLHYVHQLQNLYFALTEKELEFKP